jgi:hypothetical protein
LKDPIIETRKRNQKPSQPQNPEPSIAASRDAAGPVAVSKVAADPVAVFMAAADPKAASQDAECPLADLRAVSQDAAVPHEDPPDRDPAKR